MAAYRFNGQAMRILRRLREDHGLEADGEVILRALALLEVADEVVGEDGIVTILGPRPDGSEITVQNAGRTKRVRVWRQQEAKSAVA